MEADFVDRLGLITSEELIDAVSVGQITPGTKTVSAKNSQCQVPKQKVGKYESKYNLY